MSAERDAELRGLWMVPFADLMSTLVILFLALFGYAYSSRSPEYEKALAHMQQELAALPQAKSARARVDEADLALKLKAEMKGLALDEFGLEVTSQYIHLVLPAPVLFPEGSARLSPRAGRLLESLAKLFATVPNPVLVAGHTDNQRIVSGHYRTNWELSAARAFSVVEFFLKRGLAPERFHARGYGEHRPVAANDTSASRHRNRRIEISLIRSVDLEEGRP